MSGDLIVAYKLLEKPSAYGSLVYGGYDQSRFVPNDITFPFDANDSRKPSVNIQSIVSRDLANTTVGMLPDGAAYSLIDFAEPHMWLPVSTCDAFARAFNLTYDNTTDLYLVDAATRARLLERNPSITFGLGTTANPAERVNVVLPYSAFDQQATYPIYPNTTNYFPIRRAYNDTQYTIGRTFFQEAYVRIDYDRGNFSVHQALFPASNDKQNIVSVLSPEPSKEPAKDANYSKITMRKGSIVGISVGVASALTLILILALYMHQRRKVTNQRRAAALQNRDLQIEIADQPKLETDGVALYEKDSRPFAEMEGHGCQKRQASLRKADEMDAGITSADWSSIIELYEMDGGDVFFVQEQDLEVRVRNQPPPGWI
jgi:hypothetical protein